MTVISPAWVAPASRRPDRPNSAAAPACAILMVPSIGMFSAACRSRVALHIAFREHSGSCAPPIAPLDGTGGPRDAWGDRDRETAMNVQASPSKLIKGATGDWEVVVGLEVHAQVNSLAKLFSGAATAFGAEPNSHVSLIDAAMPGMLPVINEACVAQAVRTGLGLTAKITLRSVFDRKNYFYPDLPQGYQISQYKFPVVG